MGSLIQRITSLGAAGYGVNILEKAPPGAAIGVSKNTLGVVMEAAWGPENVVTTITSADYLFSLFAPGDFNNIDTYPVMKAFLTAKLPKMQVVRVLNAGAVKAALTLLDSTAGNSIVATAKYKGVSGDKISIAVVDNAGVSFNKDIKVSVGAYSKTYVNAVVDNGGSITLATIDDKYVDFAVAAGATLPPVAAISAPLAGGSDGTTTAADYVGSASSSVGIRLFYGASVSIGALVVAECPVALIDAVNVGLKAFGTDISGPIAVLCTSHAQTLAAATAYPATYASDFVVSVYPRVQIQNSYDPNLGNVYVDGNILMAVNMLGHDEWLSPGGKSSAQFYTRVLGLENATLSKADYDALNAAGVAPFFSSSTLGMITHRAVTTSLVVGKTTIARRRMATYLQDSMAALGENYAEEPLDLTLSSQTLGTITGAFVGELNAYLSAHKVQGRIAAFSVDAFSANSQAGIDAGTWNIVTTAKLFSSQDEIILTTNIGEFVAL